MTAGQGYDPPVGPTGGTLEQEQQPGFGELAKIPEKDAARSLLPKDTPKQEGKILPKTPSQPVKGD
jgi:hypothetical protein